MIHGDLQCGGLGCISVYENWFMFWADEGFAFKPFSKLGFSCRLEEEGKEMRWVVGSLLGRISWQTLMAVSLIPLAWNYRIVGVIAAQVHHFHKKSFE